MLDGENQFSDEFTWRHDELDGRKLACEVKTVNHVFKLIGKTLMVKVKRMNPNPKAESYTKLELFNSTGSSKALSL